MSKTLVKILDYSIFPAAVVVLSKFIGILIVSRLFNIAWSLREYTGSYFAVSTVLKEEDVLLLTAYSDLFMYTVIALFLSVAIFRAIFLHNTHASEMTILSLSRMNLLNLIKDTYTVYASASGWWIFTIFTNLIIWFNYLTGKGFLWIAVATTISSLVLSLVLILDVYREIYLIRKHPSKYKWH